MIGVAIEALKQHARLLYIIALFQMLGGPLVLGGLLVLTRADPVEAPTLSARITLAAAAMQRMNAGMPLNAASPGEVSPVGVLPEPARAPLAPKPSHEGKVKWMAVCGCWPAPIIFQKEPPAYSRRHEETAIARGQAPPGRPPRLCS